MAQPVQIEVQNRGDVWAISRDGREVRRFSHADEAVHEAARLARELIDTGEPAEVRIETDRGMIAVDLTESARLARPEDPNDEASAVIPDRGPSA